MGGADGSVSCRDPGLALVLTNFGCEGTRTKFRLLRIFRVTIAGSLCQRDFLVIVAGMGWSPVSGPI